MDIFLTPPPASPQPPAALRYIVALGTLALALALSLLFRSFFAPVPFMLFYAAVAVNALYSGLRVGVLSALVAVVLVESFLIPPFSVLALGPSSLLRGAVFVFVASLISWLSEARRHAEARAEAQAERFHVTLASIADAVIATDSTGHVTFLNQYAEALTGWRLADAVGKDSTEVFQIIDADTRQPVASPVTWVLREGTSKELADHMLLIAQDGAERPVDASGAPMSDPAGSLSASSWHFGIRACACRPRPSGRDCSQVSRKRERRRKQPWVSTTSLCPSPRTNSGRR
ncbi:MAG: DUF4118 domain-containing protein [Roseiflexaceae bacterium]